MRLLALVLLSLSLSAQVAKQANERYQTPEGRKEVSANPSAPYRDQRQKPRELVQAMRLLRGMTVADVGTGIGYMLPFLSRAVEPYGKVIAGVNPHPPEQAGCNQRDRGRQFPAYLGTDQIKDSQYVLILDRN
jgi:predicted methyltransferase